MDIPDIATEIIRLGADNCMDGAMIWGLAGEETIHRCIYEKHYIGKFINTPMNSIFIGVFMKRLFIGVFMNFPI